MESLTPEEIRHYVESLKVLDLKEHIKAFNERLPFLEHMRLSGNKPELLKRVHAAIDVSSRSPRNYQELLMVMAPLGLTHFLGDISRMRHAAHQYVCFVFTAHRPDTHLCLGGCLAQPVEAVPPIKLACRRVRAP